MNIILASTSLYRRRLLERLQIPFRCISPQADETPLAGETPSELALRLALTKARSVARLHPDAVVIGSDQVATIEGHIIGKPGSFEPAKKQLQDSSGRDIHFYTAVSIVLQGQQLERFHVEPTTAHFRTLDDTQIEDYLNKEQPYDCAGSFKIEGLGITLFEGITGNDPTALEGLPLIKLTELLGETGVGILQPQAN
jgi:septum formation protein